MKTIPELIAELDVMPQKVAGQREDVVRLKGLHAAAKRVLDDLEADALDEVSLERNEADKPKYTNKEARESAVRTLLASKPEHRRALAVLESVELALQNSQIQLGLLDDTQKSLYAQLDAARAGLQADAVRGLVQATLELARVEASRLTQKETP
jgi:hypothetical protein